MAEQDHLKQVRDDIEAWKVSRKLAEWQAQREEMRRGKATLGLFYLDGDRTAKPVARAGLIVLALMFGGFGISFAMISFKEHFEDGSAICLVMGTAFVLLAMVMIRNALRGPRKK